MSRSDCSSNPRLVGEGSQVFLLLPRSLQRLIIGRRPLREEVVFVVGEVLREGDGDQFFLRINLAISRGRSIPAKLTEAGGYCASPWVDADFHSEAKSLGAIEGVRSVG